MKPLVLYSVQKKIVNTIFHRMKKKHLYMAPLYHTLAITLHVKNVNKKLKSCLWENSVSARDSHA